MGGREGGREGERGRTDRRTSPHLSQGLATTATSAMEGWRCKAFSTCAKKKGGREEGERRDVGREEGFCCPYERTSMELMFSPPLMMTSLLRS